MGRRADFFLKPPRQKREWMKNISCDVGNIIYDVRKCTGMSVLYRESHVDRRKVFRVIKQQDGKIVRQQQQRSEEKANNDDEISFLGSFFRRVFLPSGYPDSVSSDYVAYQIWDTVQAFASAISGSLATQAVLKGVGVGDETASALSATITWLLRHGAGMAGQIVFTWMEGCDLDHSCKKWRLFADVLNDTAMLLELSGPLWPQKSFQVSVHFLRLLSCCFINVSFSSSFVQRAWPEAWWAWPVVPLGRPLPNIKRETITFRMSRPKMAHKRLWSTWQRC